jgi:hypothetical protein
VSGLSVTKMNRHVVMPYLRDFPFYRSPLSTFKTIYHKSLISTVHINTSASVGGEMGILTSDVYLVVQLKVKQSHYRLGQALGVPEI